MDTIDEKELKDFIELHLRLLEAEYNEELKESDRLKDSSNLSQLEVNGLAIRNLCVDSCSSLHGKYVVEFKREQSKKKQQYQQHITSGDVVYAVTTVDMQRTLIGIGVVMCINDDSIAVSFNIDLTSKFESGGSFVIIRTASFITYKRMRKALQKIPTLVAQSASVLVELLFGKASLQTVPIHPKLLNSEGKLKYVNDKLHSVQKEAVEYALKQKNFAIIHGPPGTGKTTTLVEIIIQLTNVGNKVLVCAPSNIAVDNVLEKLLKFRVKVVRLGHPARMLNSIKVYSLDSAVSAGSSAQVLRDVKEELKNCERQLEKTNNNKQRYHLRGELKELKRELHARKDRAQKEVLLGANVVLTTLVTASREGPLGDLPEDHFDVVIIDECSQALEAECWIALPWANKVILAGDHLQLPPTVMSKTALEGGLCKSLMERAIEKFGSQGYRLLTHQYRMHADIMTWVSQEMYDKKLEADSSVEDHLLRDLPGVEETEETSSVLLFVNTAGCDLGEMEQDDAGSRGNEGEANIIYMLVKHLIEAGVSENLISVITPYSLQVACIKSKLISYPAVEVRTVDGFQGREKEAVLLSLVRSNARGDLGFVSDRRRLNVAVSRARRFLGVVADSNTVGRDKTIASLLDHIELQGTVVSAHEFLQEINNGIEMPQFVAKHTNIAKKKKVNTSNKTNGSARDTKPKQKQSKNLSVTAKVLEESKNENKNDINFWKDKIQTLMLETGCNEYKFPSNLTSFERKMVHEAAESLSFQHESVGEGDKRHIVVRSVCLPVLKREKTKSKKHLNQEPERQSSSNQCGVEVLEREQVTKSDHSKPNKISEAVCNPSAEVLDLPLLESCEDASTTCQPNLSKSNRSKKKKKEPEDVDSLLEAFQKLNNTCNINGCKTSVQLMGQKCEHCNKMYCFSHALPEIHGCGEAARRVARYKFQHPSPPKVDPIKRRAASSKLKKTLSEMSDSRKQKKHGK
ncbi:DNA-binding protein SMUBP-2 [Anabrus simplex]|uniref:DNA-binding protein SMUBP-2 n=1 Tax=Anabrus simplex TaxID=316456 RepID=UPI0035A39A63